MVSPEAERIHRSSIIVEAHRDMFEMVRLRNMGEKYPVLNTTLPRLKKGGVTVTFYAICGDSVSHSKGTYRYLSAALENIDAPNGYTIRGEGQGGVAGFAKGSADVKLVEEGNETVLTYLARAEVGGKLASVGSRLVEGVAKKTADDFFGKFSQIVGDGAAAAATRMQQGALQAPASAAGPSLSQSGEVAAGISPWIWGVGLVAVVGILWYVLAR